MNFRSHPGRRRPNDGLDLTPLIDVVFLLLIFFLITSSYVQERRPNIPIEVPTAATGEDRSQVENVVVHISAAGDLFLDKKPMESIEALRAGLEVIRRRSPGTLVLIRSDRNAPFGSSVRVMDVARKVGLDRFGIVTQSPD